MSRRCTSISKEEGDEIAAAVLRLVRELAKPFEWGRRDALDVNVRPEPPEARLGFLPERKDVA